MQKLLTGKDIDSSSELDELYDVEDAILALQHVQERIYYCKELKKRRMTAIDKYVKSFSKHEEVLRAIIGNTMKKHKTATANFPGVGSVKMRKAADKWEVTDEIKLIEWLEEKSVDKTVVKKSIQKNELNKLIKTDVAGIKKAEGLNKIEGQQSPTVSFETKLMSDIEEKIEEKLPDDIALIELDTLEV